MKPAIIKHLRAYVIDPGESGADYHNQHPGHKGCKQGRYPAAAAPIVLVLRGRRWWVLEPLGTSGWESWSVGAVRREARQHRSRSGGSRRHGPASTPGCAPRIFESVRRLRGVLLLVRKLTPNVELVDGWNPPSRARVRGRRLKLWKTNPIL